MATKQEIIDRLSQCGGLSYQDWIRLLDSIYFDGDIGDVFIPVTSNVLPENENSYTVFSIITEGTYTQEVGAPIVVPEGHIAIISNESGVWFINGNPINVKGDMPEGTDTLQPELIPKGKAIIDYSADKTVKTTISNANVFNPYINSNVNKRVSLVSGGNLETQSGYYTSDYIVWGENNNLLIANSAGWEQYDANFNRVNYSYYGTNASVINIPKHTSAVYVRVSISLANRFTQRAVFGDLTAYNNAVGQQYELYSEKLINDAPIVFKAKTAVKIEKNQALPIQTKALFDLKQNLPKIKTISKNVFNPYYEDGVNFRLGFPNLSGAGVEFYTSDLIEWGENTTLAVAWCAGHCQYDDNLTEMSKAGVPATASVITITKNPNAKYLRISVPIDKRFTQGAVFGVVADYNLYNKQPFRVASKTTFDNKPINDDVVKKSLTIEDFQRDFNIGQGLAGNILFKSNKNVHYPISNLNTQLDYDILNYERFKPQGVITNRRFFNITNKYLHWIGKYGKIYWSRSSGVTDFNVPLVSNNIQDFINDIYINIAGAYGSEAGARAIVGIRELDNGELLIMQAQNLTSGNSGVFVSSGWANNKTVAPTWTKKLTYLNQTTGIIDSWGCSIRGNKILVSEYAISGDSWKNDSAVWYSNDYGNTFTQVATIESLNQYVGTIGDLKQHIHGVAVDPYWNRLWIMLGEGARTGQHVIVYSDDEGATWKAVGTLTKQKTLIGGGTQLMKFCGVYAYKSGLAMGTDSQPNGIWRYNRNSKEEAHESQTLNIEEVKRVDLHVSNTPIAGFSGHERYISHIMGYTIPSLKNDFYLVTMNYSGVVASTYQQDRSSLVYFTCDGVKFYEIYREEDLVNYPNRDGFVDNFFKAFELPNKEVVIFSSGSGRNAGNTLIVGNLPNIF